MPLPAQAAPAQSSTLRIGAVAVIASDSPSIAVGAAAQIVHLIWRPAEVGRMLGAAGSLAVDFPGRFTVLPVLGVAVMLAAEYRPRALLGGAVAFWIGIGWIGVSAYALGLLDVGSRPRSRRCSPSGSSRRSRWPSWLPVVARRPRSRPDPARRRGGGGRFSRR